MWRNSAARSLRTVAAWRLFLSRPERTDISDHPSATNLRREDRPWHVGKASGEKGRRAFRQYDGPAQTKRHMRCARVRSRESARRHASYARRDARPSPSDTAATSGSVATRSDRDDLSTAIAGGRGFQTARLAMQDRGFASSTKLRWHLEYCCGSFRERSGGARLEQFRFTALHGPERRRGACAEPRARAASRQPSKSFRLEGDEDVRTEIPIASFAVSARSISRVVETPGRWSLRSMNGSALSVEYQAAPDRPTEWRWCAAWR